MPSFAAWLLANRQGIGVVEAERHGHAEAHRREATIDLVERRAGVELQDLARDRAGVLGVDVDRAALERREHDAGVAEARLVLGLHSGANDGPAQDLAEDVALGEALGADLERRILSRSDRRGERRDQREKRPHAAALSGSPAPPRNCSSARRA
jgi:hypothetical protein